MLGVRMIRGTVSRRLGVKEKVSQVSLLILAHRLGEVFFFFKKKP